MLSISYDDFLHTSSTGQEWTLMVGPAARLGSCPDLGPSDHDTFEAAPWQHPSSYSCFAFLCSFQGVTVSDSSVIYRILRLDTAQGYAHPMS